MFSQKKYKTKKASKHHGNIYLVYPHDIKPKILPNPIISSFYYEETFHKIMKLYLTIAQIFAIMPINGINGPTAASLHYSFCSLRNFYTLVIIVAQLAHAAIIFYWIFRTEYNFQKILSVIWFTVNPFVMYQFIRVARKWPDLMQHWENFEMTVAYRDVNTHKQMCRIILAMSIGIPILACIEHIFSLGKNVKTAGLCKNITDTDTMTAYFTEAFPGFFYFFKVNYVNGISMQMVNLYSTFTWSMTDTFILLVTLGLLTQFHHFNKNIERFDEMGQHLPAEYWGKQRLYFTKLTKLLDHVNKDLAVLILTSFMVNTFYICIQLFNSIAAKDSLMQRTYYWFSLIYLIGKTFLVTMTATLINDEAKKPIKVLESVPPASYGSDATRFMHQLTSGTIALGGMQFFYITRTFLISMAGTIVTYEVLLMQFKQHSYTGYDPCKF